MHVAILIAKTALSAGLIWYVLAHADLGDLFEIMSGIDLGWLAVSVAAMGGHLATCFLRWQEIITGLGGRLGLRPIIVSYYGAMFVNTFLPGTVGGDLLRMFYAARHGLGSQTAIHSVVLERVATVLGLLVLTSVFTPLLATAIDETWLLVGFNIATVGAAIGLFAFGHLYQQIPKFTSWKPMLLIASFGEDTRKLFLRLTPCVRVLTMTNISHLFSGICIYALAMGLGIEVSFWLTVAVAIPVLLLAGLPISVNGWGVREGAMVAAFAPLGVPVEGALSVSILFGILSTVVALPGVFYWLQLPKPKTAPPA